MNYYRLPEGFDLSHPEQTLSSEAGHIQLRSVYKTFREHEAYTIPDHLIFIPLMGKKIFYSDHNSYPSEAGNLLFIRKDSTVSCDLIRLDQERFEAILFALDSQFISEVLYKYRVPSPQDSKRNQDIFSIDISPILKFCIESLFPFFVHHTEQREALIRLKIEELMVNLIGSIDPQGHLFESFLYHAIDSQRQAFLNLIETQIAHPSSIEKMASELNMSVSGFKREFKRLFHNTPSRLIQEKRIDRACQLLKNPALNITEVGLKTGFESSSHFIQVFKKKKGLTPGQYQLNQMR